MHFFFFCWQANYSSTSYSLLIFFPDTFESSQSPKWMRPKRSSLLLLYGIPILFAIKGIERCVENNGQLAEVPFSTWRKGSYLFGQFSTQFSHWCLIVSCSSCKHLFWIDLFHLNQERIQILLFFLPGTLFKYRQIWRAFCCSVLLSTGQI